MEFNFLTGVSDMQHNTQEELPGRPPQQEE